MAILTKDEFLVKENIISTDKIMVCTNIHNKDYFEFKIVLGFSDKFSSFIYGLDISSILFSDSNKFSSSVTAESLRDVADYLDKVNLSLSNDK
jgi:hypothetical protein